MFRNLLLWFWFGSWIGLVSFPIIGIVSEVQLFFPLTAFSFGLLVFTTGMLAMLSVLREGN